MLRLIEEKEYIDTLKWLNEENIETYFKPELSKRKNHLGFVFMKMESEDGSNALQAMASAEIYSTNKGKVAVINSLFVMPEFRGNEYGKIILFHLIKNINENVNDMYSFMATSNVCAFKSFIKNGFECSDGTKEIKNNKKNSFRLYKEA